MNQAYLQNDILIDRRKKVAVITLNNRASLNALTLEMVRQISIQLHKWKDDPEIKAIFFKGAGEKAFCSGADIRSFYYCGMDYRRNDVSARVPTVFFGEEYHMCKMIASYPKPTISLMNGIVMGGGYGIGGHCTYRVASENTLFAMPEVGIGFYPDVGSVYHLLKAPHAFGRYLALSGQSVKAGDMLDAGLTDFFIPSTHYDALIEEVSRAPEKAQSALQSYHEPNKAESATFKTHQADIEEAFSPQNLGAVLAALKGKNSAWHKKTLTRLLSVSPLSVLITAEYLKRARNMTLEEVFAMDFTLTQHFIDGSDIYEGIRARLIDKDGKPQWEYPMVKDCPANVLKHYFAPTDYALSDIEIFE